ncbi:MAG: hypothetical protein KU28_00520 [Sulfurovum sp. PC08-66]|nr:MAG: hypothetical protein KU28_00520 [Sulfurovum sp. PC08-66]KIM12451.1 MAG: hypothetical protein KU37_00635 [Sulfuricurvum sp. PC08-66]
MSRVIELFLFDVLVAICKIEKTISDFDNSNDLKHNYLAWDSVIREFEIIGEAAKHLLDADILEKDKREIVNFRNVLVHEYFGIDEDEVYEIGKYKLQALKQTIISKIRCIENNLKLELIEDFLEENNYLHFIKIELENLK